MRKLIQTPNDVTALILRLALGIVIFPHGAQKLLGIWGGYGFSGTMGFFTGQMGIPYVFALLAIIAEFFGALGLIVGFLTRIAAVGLACVMAVAMFKVHLGNGFFMLWDVQPGMQAPRGEGFEYHILALGIALALMIKGGGAASVDRALSRDRDLPPQR